MPGVWTTFAGTSANGNGGEYRYYTCRSRLERGRSGCNQDRIPASDIERAIVDHLLNALDNEMLLSACLDKHVNRLENVGENDEEELSKCERDVRQTRSTIDRYLSAFETGSMPADSCGPRLRELEARLAELETLKLSIESRIETKSLNSPSLDEVKSLAAEVRAMINAAHTEEDLPALKRLIEIVIPRVLVESRDRIRPVISMPLVRIMDSWVGPAGFEPATNGL